MRLSYIGRDGERVYVQASDIVVHADMDRSSQVVVIEGDVKAIGCTIEARFCLVHESDLTSSP